MQPEPLHELGLAQLSEIAQLVSELLLAGSQLVSGLAQLVSRELLLAGSNYYWFLLVECVELVRIGFRFSLELELARTSFVHDLQNSKG